MADVKLLPGEEWRPVPGYEGFYSVSSLGRVRSEDHLIPNSRGGGLRMLRGKVRRLTPNDNGYLRCFLSKRNVVRTHYAHRLVAAAFIGPCPEGMEVNHRDGSKENNAAANLEYVTKQVNNDHAWANGLAKNKGAAHYKTDLTEDEVRAIRREYAAGGITQAKLGARYGVTQSCVFDILKRRRWAHVA